ncbi:ferritin-like domain-containing protein [Neobacillus sp. OS1-32]|uniref:Ferritin-like domain-containing protein n=1 Tax=Neobacillus paridis TaxID=2803862 RepID=A0ABS1THB3_9BACI|nr:MULTISPECIES: ferritin-like domain-containing protein [Neobacillus]MBL4950705.1 ferritin-like domain-containing protein [Neobacillus paridis]WML31316.1 ferritin-like domain-containing protein [Neobacillus sp. OS1-32]
MQNQQMNQMQMQSPPPAVTTKDLQYLKDALSWELLAFKKFHFLAQQATDEDIKQALDNAGKMHQNHYQRLLTHLQVNNNQVLAGMQNMQQNQQQNLQ